MRISSTYLRVDVTLFESRRCLMNESLDVVYFSHCA